MLALCDKLEQEQMSHIKTNLKLAKALLQNLTDAKDAEELKTAWQHLEPHFDILFTTEESVELLKQTILQLAVMGKLVPQNSNDEPASKLLEKIAAEKQRLIKEGKIKKQKTLPEITEEEKPFELPEGWEWCRLGDVSILKGGFAYKSSKFIKMGNNQVIRMGNIRPVFLRLNENPVFIPNDLAEETAEYKIELGDILLTMTGTKGKRDYLYSLLITSDHIYNKDLYLNQRLCILRTFLFQKYLNQVIKNDFFLDLVYAKSTGTANQANIGMVAISDWVIPIPPVNEQHRIILKLEKLINLCDQLKERIIATQELKVKLADAVVEQTVKIKPKKVYEVNTSLDMAAEPSRKA